MEKGDADRADALAAQVGDNLVLVIEAMAVFVYNIVSNNCVALVPRSHRDDEGFIG